MAVSYCEQEDVYRQGVPRGVLVLPARPIASVDTSGNTLVLEGHGLVEDEPFQLQADAGGSLPAPLAAATVYYAEPVDDSDSLLRVRATPGGAAIDITTAGANFSLVYSAEIGRMIDAARESASRFADGCLTGHVVPLTAPFPPFVVTAVAEISASKVLRKLGRVSQQIIDMGIEAREDLRTMVKGLPLRDAAATPQVPFARGVTPRSTRWGGCDPKVIR